MSDRAPLESAENAARRLAEGLSREMPPGWGFGLVLYTIGEAGYVSWISSGRREDMARALEELLARWKRNEPSV